MQARGWALPTGPSAGEASAHCAGACANLRLPHELARGPPGHGFPIATAFRALGPCSVPPTWEGGSWMAPRDRGREAEGACRVPGGIAGFAVKTSRGG